MRRPQWLSRDQIAAWYLEHGVQSGACLLWPGRTDAKGYVQVYVDGRPGKLHRFMWEHYNGRRLAPGMFSCHTCDTPNCFAKAHLYEGTAKQNARDCVERGRYAVRAGEAHGRARLCWEDVEQIRLLHPMMSLSELADFFNMSKSQVHNVVTRKSWREPRESSPIARP